MLHIRVFKLESGAKPFDVWLDQLDKSCKAKVRAYIDGVALGGSRKNVKSIGRGLYEIKIDYGPGYRVYFGLIDEDILLLVAGGDKRNQSRDIQRAREYWRQANV